jgi:ribonuclease HI
MLLNIYIDGASRGNPGPAGIGAVIMDSKGSTLRNIKEYLGETTNNIAEYRALIRALNEAMSLKAQEININTDSRLLVNQLNKSYKVKDANIKSIYNEALQLIDKFDKVKVAYIDRSENKSADKLANAAIDSASIKIKPLKDVAVFDKNKKSVDMPESLF